MLLLNKNIERREVDIMIKIEHLTKSMEKEIPVVWRLMTLVQIFRKIHLQLLQAKVEVENNIIKYDRID